MNLRSLTPVALAFVLGGAAVFAAMRTPNREEPSRFEQAAPPAVALPEPGNDQALPPNHPPVGTATAPAERDDAPALTWKVPPGWSEVASPSAMRLATYRVPASKGDAEGAEVSVIRAGGSTESNIDRWVHQFEGAGKPAKTDKTIAGYKVTTVEVTGTFLGGGMMGGADPKPKADWSLLAAIVETPSSPYFFKMTGPAATVKAAREPFMAMLSAATKP